MKGSFYGFYAFALLGMNGILLAFEWMGRFPFFRTPLYPLVALIALLLALVGAFEKDRSRLPAFAALAASAFMLGHWVVALILRLT